MTALALHLLTIMFKVAEIAALAFAVTLCAAWLLGEVDRVLLRRRGRSAARAYGLHLVARDEIADARDRRERRTQRGGAA